MATLDVPTLLDNPDSWGPPAAGNNLPVALSTRLERVPKAADWIGVTFSGANSAKELVEQDDFEVAGAEKKKTPKRPFGAQAKQPQWNNNAGRGRGNAGRGTWGGRGAFTAGRGRGRASQQAVGHASTLDIKDDWELKHHVTLTSLSRIADADVPTEHDVTFHGNCHYFDTRMDSIETHKPMALKPCGKTFYKVTPLQDETLRDIVMELAEDNKRVIVTNDNILSTLMTAPRSIFQWEVHATKSGDIVFLDWRDGDNLGNCYTVNETSANPPFDGENKEAMSSATSLSIESTSITKNLSQIVHSKQRARVDLGEGVARVDCPFVEEGDVPCNTVYRYRKFILNEGTDDEVVVVVRTEIDGAVKNNATGEVQLIRTFGINEIDDKATIHWKQNLNTSRGMILGNFIKNNACKVCRWAAMTYLSGASLVKLGYVVRATPMTNQAHSILGMETKSASEFTSQAGFNAVNAWSIIKSFAQTLYTLDDGDYMLVKESGKATLSWYYFEDAQEEEEGDAGEESD